MTVTPIVTSGRAALTPQPGAAGHTYVTVRTQSAVGKVALTGGEIVDVYRWWSGGF